jgi:hypothetical protein
MEKDLETVFSSEPLSSTVVSETEDARDMFRMGKPQQFKVNPMTTIVLH